MIDLQQVNGGDGHLSDKELVSERLGGRVKSNDSNDVPASNGQEATVGTDGGGSNSGQYTLIFRTVTHLFISFSAQFNPTVQIVTYSVAFILPL